MIRADEQQISFLDSIEGSSSPVSRRDLIGEPEDPWESLGYGIKSNPWINRMIRERSGLERTSEQVPSEETIRVALGPFELSGGGRFFSPEKVFGHLEAIGATGFQLEEGYGDFTPEKMWNYHGSVLDTIGRIALAPRFRGVLREVRARNAEYFSMR